LASTLLESLVAEIARLDGDSLVMHVGEKPYVVAGPSLAAADRAFAWHRVEVSDRPLTPDALLGMLGQMISFEDRRTLYDAGAIEIDADLGAAAGGSFVIAASRVAEDVRLEIRKRQGNRVPLDVWPASAVPSPEAAVEDVASYAGVDAAAELDLADDVDIDIEMLRGTAAELIDAFPAASVPAPAPADMLPADPPPSAAASVAAAVPDSGLVDVEETDENASPSAVILPHVRPRPASAQEPRSDSVMIEVLRLPAVKQASRLHVSAGQLPTGCIDGRMVTFVTAPVIAAADIDRFALAFRSTPSTVPEWTCSVPGVGPVTCVEFDDESGRGLVLHLPAPLRSAAELDLEPAIAALAEEADGFIVIAGPRGSGKSTLVHALADLINTLRSDYVITIESSVRVRHPKRHAIVSQRQRHGGGEAVAAAARAALREGPDVLVIDDLRSPEAIDVALDGASGGRLVIGTLAAPSVTAAVARLIDGFVTGRRPELQARLSSSLRAVVAQTLVDGIGGGRVAAREVLINGSAVAPLVCDGATWHLTAAMEAGRKLGMKTMADALSSLVRKGIVDAGTALRSAPDRDALVAALAREGIDVSDLERRA